MSASAAIAPKTAARPQHIVPVAPDELTPWRSLAALAEVLNAGAEEKTFSRHGIRHYVHQAMAGYEPTLQPYIRRIGRKLLVSEPGFLYWLATRPCTRYGEGAAA